MLGEEHFRLRHAKLIIYINFQDYVCSELKCFILTLLISCL